MVSERQQRARFHGRAPYRGRSADAKDALRAQAGDLRAATAGLKEWLEAAPTPEDAKARFQAKAAPLLALNVLEAMTPGPACDTCGRTGEVPRWPNLLAAKTLNWVQSGIEIHQYTVNLCTELGVTDLAELRRHVVASKDAERLIPEGGDDAAAYRYCLEFVNESRRRRGLADVVEPERVPELLP